jgi:hypothetical protein
VFVNLGPAHVLRDTPAPGGVLADISTELTAAFGAGWESRTDLFFGVFANQTNSPPTGLGAAAPVNGDPARTIYASRGTAVAGSSPAWSGFSVSALGIAATAHSGQIDALAPLTANGNDVLTLSQAANPVQWNNSWSEFNPVPGAAYSIFAGGIQSAINATAALVDLYRIVGTSGTGSYVTTISLSAAGEVTAAPAGPATSYFTINATATNGSVSGAGADIVYAEGSSAKLTAVPATGFGFTGWSVDASGSANPLTLVMNANKNVTATFAALPAVGTPTFTNVTGDAATIGGNVTSEGGAY